MESMGAMLQTFEEHFSHRSFTAVRLIYVVTDFDEVLQELQQSLKEWKADTQVEHTMVKNNA